LCFCSFSPGIFFTVRSFHFLLLFQLPYRHCMKSHAWIYRTALFLIFAASLVAGISSGETTLIRIESATL
jgi:hypothetical protein